MRKEYEDELKALKEKMQKAENHAKNVPMFAEKILKEKITGEENWLKYIDSYKHVRTFNGVSRGFFQTDTPRRMTNNEEYHEGYFWTTYINTLCEYNSHANYGLEKIHKNIPVYYYDRLNATFYCTDEQIEGLLEALEEWKVNAVEQAKRDRIDEDIREAEEEIKKANEKLSKLKGNK